MIRLQNKNEWLVWWATFLQALNPTAPGNTTAIGRQPTASKILDVFGMPFDGRVLALIGVVNTVGAAGNSTDLKCAYRLRNGGYDLAGTTLLTSDALAMDLNPNPDYIPIAGTRLVAPAVTPPPLAKIGEQVHLHYNESGTLGTATRPIFTPIGVVLRSEGSIDPRDIDYNR